MAAQNTIYTGCSFTNSKKDRLKAAVLTIFSVVFILTLQQVTATSVNVALNKIVSAKYTCGYLRNASRPERYFAQSQFTIKPSQRKPGFCPNTLTHAPAAMVDDQKSTFWQSTSRRNLITANNPQNKDNVPLAIIAIDLQQEFEIDYMSIEMGDSMRPNSMCVKKSDDGKIYRTMSCLVNVDSQCGTLFNLPVAFIPTNLLSTLCHVYLQNPARQFENVKFNFSQVPAALNTWRNTRYLLIELYGMQLQFGFFANEYYHYTIRDLEVYAECVCNGHQTNCIRSPTTGQFECVCGQNTQGKYCESCQPFYNQQPFKYGVACESCNCFSHANTCVYNATVERFNLSLNALSERKGGGVCQNCLHNTAGVNCEKCVNFYYRPEGTAQALINACRPCGCNAAGVTRNAETGLTGDCVMNTDTTNPLQMRPGDCFCKANVQGSKCDACKPGFFNLTAANPLGCQACECDARGSIGGGSVCHGTGIDGQCPCKPLVIGRRCSICNDGYWGLSLTNPQGCEQCLCDVGASIGNVCKGDSGQCNCKSNIGGRQCKQPLSGYFYPDPHFIAGEFEGLFSSWASTRAGYKGYGYATPSSDTDVVSTRITVSADVAFNANYSIMIRYSGNVVPLNVPVTISGTKEPKKDILFVGCPSGWCMSAKSVQVHLVNGFSYTVSVTKAANLLLDRVVAVPLNIFKDSVPTVLRSNAVAFTQNCDVYSNVMKTPAFCEAQIFSLTMSALKGASPCLCNLVGTVSVSGKVSSCTSYGGQCTCKAGVGTRTCSECLPEYYRFSFTGCEACNCATSNKICDKNTGQCVCPSNTVGRTCNHCAPNTWQWNSVTGCKSCGCHIEGSQSLQCNITTGKCLCKVGVLGDKCDLCQAGYKVLGALGCSPCNCDLRGSVNAICNSSTGQCPCKGNAGGLLCNQCRVGTFNNDPSYALGCLDCVCMGVTKSCKSTWWKKMKVPVPLRNATSRNPSMVITTQTSTTTIPVTIATVNGIEMAQSQLTTPGATGLYWQSLQGLSGNLLGLYRNMITFDVHYVSPDLTGVSTVPAVLLKGKAVTDFFRFQLPLVPFNKTTRLNVTFVEPQVQDRGKFMLALSNVDMVLFQASLYTKAHATSIGNIAYDIASPQGTGATAVAVEQCTCGPGYVGLSCEACAYGYKRINVTGHNYYGLCAKCECNKHAGYCDPNTGVCQNCLHNTAGPNCEVCKPGFYGVATNGSPLDCKPCPCFGPRVVNNTCSLVNGSVQCTFCKEGYTGALCDKCTPFYYGNPQVVNTGTCTKCNCNGNTQQCNQVTGECLNCGFNSTGFNCEQCKVGFFGNSSIQNCQACVCNMKGTNNSVCDNLSGQCACHSGVGNRVCDRCLPDYYGYNNASYLGCVPCNCNAGGSVLTQCNAQGICSCKVNAGGPKCDLCQDGFWGLPHVPCTPCNCDTLLSASAASDCERITGQCKCKPGVEGRRCDKCMRFYTNPTITGCTRCTQCQFALGNDTLALQLSSAQKLNETNDITSLQLEDARLQNMTRELNATTSVLGISSDRLSVLVSTVNTLKSTQQVYIDKVNTFMTRLGILNANVAKLDNDTRDDLNRLRELQTAGQTALRIGKEINTTAPASIEQLKTYNTSALELLQKSNFAFGGVNLSYTNELARVDEQLVKLAKTETEAVDMKQKSDFQSIAQLSNHESKTRTAEAAFRQDEQLIASSMTNLNTVKTLAATVEQAVNDTVHQRTRASTLFTDAQTILAVTDTTLKESQQDLASGRQAFTDVNTIINGKVFGDLPINTTVDLTGIRGWTQGEQQVQTQLASVNNLLNSYSLQYPNLQNKATEIGNQAKQINAEYLRVESQGKAAVDAITNYETTAATLTESLQLAQQANKTVQAVMDSVRTITVSDFEKLANDSRKASIDQLTFVNNWSVTGAATMTLLDASNASLKSAVQKWAVVDTQIGNLHTNARNLDKTVASNNINPIVVQGNTLANSVIQSANDILTLDTQHTSTINTQNGQASLVQTKVNNAAVTMSQTRTSLALFNNQVNSAVASLAQISEFYTRTNNTRFAIDAKIALLEAKLEQASALMNKLEQPVTYRSGQNASVFPIPDVSKFLHIQDEIMLDFRTTAGSSGSILYAEHTSSADTIGLRMNLGKLMFEFNTSNSGYVGIQSEAAMTSDTWYRVIATRLQNQGQLSVIKLDSGGVTATTGSASVNYARLSYNSPVYVGGLPGGSTETRLANVGFSGCLTNVKFNSVIMSVWQARLKENGLQCCGKPPTSPQPPTMDGVNFDGFGYMKLPNHTASVVSQSMVMLQFRSFRPDGVMLIMDTLTIEAYYGVFLQQGNVLFEYAAGQSKMTLKSKGTYIDGQMYRVTAMHNRTYAFLTVEHVNKSVSSVVDTVSMTNPLSWEQTWLADAQLTVGGLNPSRTAHGPVTTGFAGCINSLQTSTKASLTLVPQALNSTNSKGTMDKCFAQVVDGIGFKQAGSYATLNVGSALSPVMSIQFDMITTNPNALLFYSILQIRFVYICLYNGNIYVTYNDGLGTGTMKGAVATRGLYLSIGYKYTIKVDFTYYTPKIYIDGIERAGGWVKSPYRMNINSQTLFVGGVQSSGVRFPTGEVFPVTQSMTNGGISKIYINGILQDHHKASILAGNAMTLSGLPEFSVAPPVPPVVTTPAPPTPPPSTCAKPLAFSLSADGVRFGAAQESYLVYTQSDTQPDLMLSSFTITIKFRALQPNGLLFYADSNAPGVLGNPTYWIALYLYNGYLSFAMKTSTNNPITTKGVTSKFTYSDSQWTQVTILRLNDFMALILSDRNDYRNNQVSLNETSTLTSNKKLYIGGVESSRSGIPFTTFIKSGARSFSGCIQKVTLSTHNRTRILDLKSPPVSKGVQSCYDTVSPGVFLSGADAYAVLGTALSVASGFTFEIQIRTAQVNMTLMAAYRDQNNYLFLEVYQGKVRAVVSNSVQQGSPMMAESSALKTGTELCDNQLHTITLTLAGSFLSLKVDGSTAERFTYPAANLFGKPNMLSQQVQIGGLKDRNVAVPVHVVRESFNGCIVKLTIKAQSYLLTGAVDRKGVVAGCPFQSGSTSTATTASPPISNV